jgi:hypothetical protein
MVLIEEGRSMSEPDTKRGSPRIVGWIFIGLAILCNPWLLQKVLSPAGGFGRGAKVLILLLDIAAIALGIYLLRARQRGIAPGELVRRLYTGTALLLLNSVLLFVLANLVVSVFRPGPQSAPPNFLTVQQKYAQDPAVFRQFHPGLSDEEIKQLLAPPNITAHPTLEFMEGPVQSRFYNVGLENMRYTRFVNASNAREKINGATWIMGGSTTFGHGIRDDETIPAYLNELDSGSVYINFAAQGYHQNLEIDKLLLLLKKGYRPSRVIFIDGLNDVANLFVMNFSPAETPFRAWDAYAYRTNMEVVKDPASEFILRKMPIFDLLFSSLEESRARALPDTLFARDDNLDDPAALYHRDPVLHYKLLNRRAEDIDGLVRDTLRYQRKLIAYYQMDARFVDQIARAYGFTYAFVIQPLGNLSPENLFHADPARYAEHPLYVYASAIVRALRRAIAEGQLPGFYDLSDADEGCRSCYVDFTHYSPTLTKQIAKTILEKVPRR